MPDISYFLVCRPFLKYYREKLPFESYIIKQMGTTQGNVLAMPRHAASSQTTIRRNQIISVFTPLVISIARDIAFRTPGCETADVIQIGLMELTQVCGQADAYIRKRVEGAIKDSVDPRRRAGRGVKEFGFRRIEPGEDLELHDASPSIEDTLIAEERLAPVRKAVADLPESHRNVIYAKFGEKRKRGRPDTKLEQEAVSQVRQALAIAA
jgi:RNA polymerase sigma factor (sigma-70 family)